MGNPASSPRSGITKDIRLTVAVEDWNLIHRRAVEIEPMEGMALQSLVLKQLATWIQELRRRDEETR